MLPALLAGAVLLLPPILDDIRAGQDAVDSGLPAPGLAPAHFLVRYLLFLACLVVLEFAVGYAYQVVYQVRTGQTVGKRVMRLRAVRLDGAPLNRRAATVRWLVGMGGALVPGLAYLDGLWQLWDKPLQQCLHDKAAQTVVVKL